MMPVSGRRARKRRDVASFGRVLEAAFAERQPVVRTIFELIGGLSVFLVRACRRF
ncbi:hypothetical protein [Pseudomonas caricapapayae]|uniref:hypothetical protein n=1 Tax=Pseudomonas caricapapayae TaxID=46678 RepID=UPI001395F675|nr:hypothetical protein [Pseudomonas caricapapayae]